MATTPIQKPARFTAALYRQPPDAQADDRTDHSGHDELRRRHGVEADERGTVLSDSVRVSRRCSTWIGSSSQRTNATTKNNIER
jgi:hypothetical protein